MIELSAIIINFNTANITFNAVKSIIQNTPEEISFEIIIVDNASDIDDYNLLVKRIKTLDLVNISVYRSVINTGFSGGNMFGYQFAKSNKYIAFLNSDILFTEDCFTPLLDFMKNHQDCGIISPQSWNGKGEFVPTFDHFSTWQREIFKRRFLEVLIPQKYPRRKKLHRNPFKVNCVAGSFMLIKKQIFDCIGGFDTNIFLYSEETDLSYRMLKSGYYNYLYPSVHYTHLHGESTNRNLSIKLEQKISLLYVVRKHQGWFAHKFLLFYFSVRYFFTSLVKPRYWQLWYVIFTGAPLSQSLKLKQKISE